MNKFVDLRCIKIKIFVNLIRTIRNPLVLVLYRYGPEHEFFFVGIMYFWELDIQLSLINVPLQIVLLFGEGWGKQIKWNKKNNNNKRVKQLHSGRHNIVQIYKKYEDIQKFYILN